MPQTMMNATEMNAKAKEMGSRWINEAASVAAGIGDEANASLLDIHTAMIAHLAHKIAVIAILSGAENL